MLHGRSGAIDSGDDHSQGVALLPCGWLALGGDTGDAITGEVADARAHRSAHERGCLLSVAECVYCPLQITAVNDARHPPCPVRVDGTPDDAQLADSQPPPGLAALQRAVVRVGQQRLAGEDVPERTQRHAAVVGVQFA